MVVSEMDPRGIIFARLQHRKIKLPEIVSVSVLRDYAIHVRECDNWYISFDIPQISSEMSSHDRRWLDRDVAYRKSTRDIEITV